MDYRRINSHMILLGMVIVVGLFAAIIVRMSMLEHGADGSTANLIFVPILGARRSKAFARYRDIDEEMKRELIGFLD